MDEWPRMTGLSALPAENQGPEITDSEESLGELTVRRSHCWRRAFSTGVECGQTAEFSLSLKVGISETALNEVASSLELGLPHLKATLAGKSSVSFTITAEQTIQRKLTIVAEKCRGIRRAEWQRIDRTTFTRSKKHWLGMWKPRQLSYTVETALNVFEPDTYIYPNRACCPEDEGTAVTRSDQLYRIVLPRATVVSLGRLDPDGAVVLSRVEGRWRPGQAIPRSRLHQAFPELPEDSTDATGVLQRLPAGSGAELAAASSRTAVEVPGCPTSAQVEMAVAGESHPGLASALRHAEDSGCSHCSRLLDLFRSRSSDNRGEWIACLDVTLPPGRSSAFELSTTVERHQVRLRIASQGDDLVVDVSTWNRALQGHDVELFFVGADTAAARVALSDRGSGMLGGIGRIGSFAKLTASDGRAAVLLHAVEPGAVKVFGARVTALVRALKGEPSQSVAADPVCALTANELRRYGPAVLGVVRRVVDTRLLVGLSPAADVAPGQNLELIRAGSFLGAIVVLEVDEDLAACEFQPDGSATALPGDLVMAHSEE
jgi:hypothetical protein